MTFRCLPLWVTLVACCFSPVASAEVPAEIERWFCEQTWERDAPGPIVALGQDGDFDDQHIFAPAVAQFDGSYWLWYSGSRGSPGNRVFRLGLAKSADGVQFSKHFGNPVLQFADGQHSVLTPAPLRSADGSVLREDGRLRLWFSSARLGKSGLHTLHESFSTDGLTWTDPSPALQEHVYCPSVLKTDAGYEMWFSDVSRRPWVLRHAESADGKQWNVNSRPAIVLSQPWEAEVLVYPTVLKVDGVYLMWYGSYDNAIRRETTAIGFAASLDGHTWHKHPRNPVHRPDPTRPWESNYVGSGSVMRLADGSFRYWYASRKAPPFRNLYVAINTARWAGPIKLLKLPPEKADRGVLVAGHHDPSGRAADVLEIVDGSNAIVRAYYVPAERGAERTFIDVWVRNVPTADFAVGQPAAFTAELETVGQELIDTTCGKRSFPLLVPSKKGPQP